MKRKILSLLLVMAMGVSLLVGCGDSKDNNTEKTSNDTTDKTDENTDEHMNTYEFSDVMGEKIGVLTYNGDAIEFEKEVFDNIAYFDMCIKNENGSYTTSVKVETIVCADAETYYQERKNVTGLNEKVTGSQYSEIKETNVNGIIVQYFNHIYTMNGKEMKDFFCFVDFPVIDNKEYAVVLTMHYGREDEVLLSGIENLLVDIEIQGVKPGITAEDTSVKNDEFNDPWYNETCLTTSDGKTVNIYFVGEGGLTWDAEPDVPSSVYIYDKNQDVCFFSVSDAATPEEYANNMIAWNDHLALEISSHEEIQLAGRTIHKYQFVDKETGEEFLSEGVIQLASDVVFKFTYKHMKYDDLEEVLEELRFVVE